MEIIQECGSKPERQEHVSSLWLRWYVGSADRLPPCPSWCGFSLGVFRPSAEGFLVGAGGVTLLSAVRQHSWGLVHHLFDGDGEMEEGGEGYGVSPALMFLA